MYFIVHCLGKWSMYMYLFRGLLTGEILSTTYQDIIIAVIIQMYTHYYTYIHTQVHIHIQPHTEFLTFSISAVPDKKLSFTTYTNIKQSIEHVLLAMILNTLDILAGGNSYNYRKIIIVKKNLYYLSVSVIYCRYHTVDLHV